MFRSKVSREVEFGEGAYSAGFRSHLVRFTPARQAKARMTARLRHNGSNVGRLVLACASTLLLSSAERASALTTADDLCTGNPCIISSNQNIDNGSVLDFGFRLVILEAKLDVGSGSMRLLCGGLTVQGKGQLRGKGGLGSPGGSIIIESWLDIVLNGTPLGGTVMLNGTDGGTLSLSTFGGTVTGFGELNLKNSVLSASGGDLSIATGGSVNLTGELNLGGGADGDGGSIDIVAVGDVSMTGPIDISGGGFGGGFLDISSGGSVTLGSVLADGGGEGGDGGATDIIATGSITLTGSYDARGSLGIERCGDGGDVDLLAGGDVTLGATMELNGPGSCCGGAIMIDGQNLHLQSSILIRGTASEGCGGSMEASAENLLSLTGDIEADGGEGGGDICLLAGGDLQVQGLIDARGRTELGSGPLFIELEAGGVLSISNHILGHGGTNGFGGDLVLTGCEITVSPSVSVTADGIFGAISFFANDKLTLGGTYSAGPLNAVIDIFFGPQAGPPNLSGASFNIPPSVLLDLLLVPCQLCETDAECDDGDPCTDNACVPGTGCVKTNNSASCSDGSACTDGDVCETGACVPGPLLDCSDGNLCTNDVCDPIGGCSNPDNSDPCDDGSVCSVGDFCGAGSCVPGPPLDCSDGNICTDDLCDAIGGCSNPDNSNLCEDGSACTEGDVCSGGSCLSGPPRDCADSNECTDDSCNPASGCVHTDNNDPCDVSDPCTTGGACSGGSCSSVPIDCNDSNPCTNDSCAGGVCNNAFNSAQCDDGDACTTDSCDSIDGCQNEALPNCTSADADGDLKLDSVDECTTHVWTLFPNTPPNQHPIGFGLSLRNLMSPGAQQIKAKGFFNPGPFAPPMDPSTDGVHVQVSDESGLLYEVNVPGGLSGSSPCSDRDGWRADVRPGKIKWKYRNRSGALPPLCVPGSAMGLSSLQIKDRRNSAKQSYQFKLKAKDTTLLGTPSLPVRRMQFDLVMGVAPSPGEASTQAIQGLCAEALIIGDPIAQKSKPSCKVETIGTTASKIDCKGI